MDVPGIEPGAFRMRSGRDTTTLHARDGISCENRLAAARGVGPACSNNIKTLIGKI